MKERGKPPELDDVLKPMTKGTVKEVLKTPEYTDIPVTLAEMREIMGMSVEEFDNFLLQKGVADLANPVRLKAPDGSTRSIEAIKARRRGSK